MLKSGKVMAGSLMLLGFLFSHAAAAVGACNSAGCWRMKIMNISVDNENARVWVTFETDTIAPLGDGGSFATCQVKSFPVQGSHPALFIKPKQAAYDQTFAQLLTAFALRQEVGFVVIASDWVPAGGLPYCTLTKLYFYRPECNNGTAVCS